jgi:hypothetical protein
MKKQSNPPEYFTDSDGRRLVRLHVHGSDTPATTEADLYDSAIRRHSLTGSIYMSSDGKGHRYVVATVPGSHSHSPFARLLLDRPKGYRVRYNDGDPLNLLPENFRLTAPWADEATASEALAVHLASARRGEEGEA